MAKMMSVKVDVTKIDKAKLFKGQKGTYLDLTVCINDENDTYGNNVSAWQGQSKEEQQAKQPKNYLGNGKVFWTNEGNLQQQSNGASGFDVGDNGNNFGEPPVNSVPVNDDFTF